jgi:hypothetical protein
MRKKTTRVKKSKPKRRKKYVPKKIAVDLPFNMNHPDLAPQVEFAFECGGKEFYRMAHEFRLPTGRYKFLDAFLIEHELRMTPKMFHDYLDRIENQINGRGGVIEISKIAVTVHNMRTHANLLFVPDTIKKLASVVYFDETEDLRDYDADYAKKKIALWETDEQYAFFLKRPIVELLNLEGISVTSLQTYIQSAQGQIEELTLDQSKQSLENSLKTETSKSNV